MSGHASGMAIVMEIDERVLAAKFDTILPHLDERQRRLLMAAEARSLGYGGISLVARAAGVSRVTVTTGVDELDGGAEPLAGRARRPGGGRKPLTDLDAGLIDALDALVEPETRGDPMTRLRWTTKSTRNLADELGRQGHQVSHHSVGRLLAGPLDYSLQGNAKTLEGRQHPDRDAQFRYIAGRVAAALAAREPVISVDAKKKELIGQYARAGREWRPSGDPRRADVHDFPGEQGKAVPYGVYDLAADGGWVSVGSDGDTAQFAVETIPAAAVEERTRHPRRRDRPGDHGLPHAARHVQVEQDRAPAVQPHLDELGRAAADQPRSRRQSHRRNHHPHRPDRPRRTRHQHLPPRHQDHRPGDESPGQPVPQPARLARRMELHHYPGPRTQLSVLFISND
jgi:hypothetical protein